MPEKHIIVIDAQRYWRELATSTLRNQGFRVYDLATYSSFPTSQCFPEERPDLVVLGCATIGPGEKDLIAKIQQQHYPLLVLCTILSGELIRSLFLQKVNDIAEKSYHPDQLIQTVRRALPESVPIDSRQVSQSLSSEKGHHMARPRRILIVDDLEEWREELKEVLIRAGFVVETASTASEGFEHLKEGLFHVLILDIRLQEADQSNDDGIRLLEELKKLGLNEAITVIMLSAYVTVERTRAVFKDYAVADFVFKHEFKKHLFREQIHQIFAQHVKINLDLAVRWHSGYNWEKATQELHVEGASIQRSALFSDQITAELTDLFCRLFFQAKSILARPLAPGHSGASVMRVKPFYENGGGREVVVKFGRVEQIKQEYENYQHYVRPYIGGGRNTSVLEMRRTPRLGGIIYSLLGTANDQLEDFGSFYHRASASQIKEVLECLFRETCGDWYANRGNLQPIDLTEDYRRFLSYPPEKLEEIRTHRLPSVEGAHSLTFKSLTGKHTFLNPIRATESLEFVHPTYACITHGDFNPHNLMVDNNGHVWLIDFQETNQSHILRDVATLDAVVRFQLLTAREATLDERFELEEALNKVDHFSQLDQLPSNFSTSNEAIAKAYKIVLYLRKQAHHLVQQNPDDNMNEYYVASLYTAMNTLRFSTLSPVQLEHALLCASLLADRLLSDQ
jgi:DNA-binding response OmpR family regulator